MKRYFSKFEVLPGFDWSSIGPRKIEPLFEEFNALNENLKLRMGEDFYNLCQIGSAGGKAVIIDEARFHLNSETVAPALAELPDLLSCAFWVYFERPDLWNGALFFAVADLKLLTSVAVRKPNRQEWFRVHPNLSIRLDTLILEMRDERQSRCAWRPTR